MTKTTLSISLQDLFSTLKQGHESYQEFFRSGELPLFETRSVECNNTMAFMRPKIGFVMLAKDSVSPALLFRQPESQVVVEYVDPAQSYSAETLQRIEWAVQSNRLRLLVVLTPLSSSTVFKKGILEELGRWFRRLKDGIHSDLIRFRKALLDIQSVRLFLTSQSEFIRSSVERGDLVLIEAIYDSSLGKVHLDLEPVFTEEVLKECS